MELNMSPPTIAYEIRNKTSVIEFGCLPHPIYTIRCFPDGITPDGIMLEIKCPYSREIKGYPPIYWTPNAITVRSLQIYGAVIF